MRTKLIAGAAVACAAVLGAASPAYAHFCFNEAKSEHAPMAGVKGTFDVVTETFTPTGPGNGAGGFVLITAGGAVLGSSYSNTLLPDGARQSGPGADATGGVNDGCDGRGNGDLLDCLGIPHDE